MPFDFDVNLTPQQVKRPREDIFDGEDIALRAGEMFETKNGDIATVTGVQAARQSVNRELPANPGSFPRRPQWGGGLSGMLMKGATSSVRDRIVSRAKARLLANPRIVKVHEVSAQVIDGGIRLTVRADALGGFIDEQLVIKPPGVR